ncbi:unnamed protein product [Calypogeia fissa]
MMKFLIFASLLLAVASAARPLGETLGGTPTDLRWKVTFEETWSNTALPNWIIDVGTQYAGGSPQFGTGEVERITPANIAVTPDQTLAITPVLGPDGTWTSGRLESVPEFQCFPGGKLRVQALMKVGDGPESQQQGIWPAFWALGAQFRGNYQNWPMVSEWDFFEAINGIPTMYTTLHCGIAPGGPCNEDTGIQGKTPFTPGKFHKVSFIVDRSMSGPGQSGTWLDETLTWYLDEVLVFTVSGAMVNDEQAWEQVAHQPHFLLLDVAVGGSFPNAIAGGQTPTAATIGGASAAMEVFDLFVFNWAP